MTVIVYAIYATMDGSPQWGHAVSFVGINERQLENILAEFRGPSEGVAIFGLDYSVFA